MSENGREWHSSLLDGNPPHRQHTSPGARRSPRLPQRSEGSAGTEAKPFSWEQPQPIPIDRTLATPDPYHRHSGSREVSSNSRSASAQRDRLPTEAHQHPHSSQQQPHLRPPASSTAMGLTSSFLSASPVTHNPNNASNHSSSGANGQLVQLESHEAQVFPSGSHRHRNSAEVYAQLTTAEREIAALREETAAKAAETAMVKANLQREHEAHLKLQASRETEVDEVRQDYEKRMNQLLEQVNVLKSISEAAQSDKKRTQDEAHHRKQQLMALLEKEREEKSRIMADYRGQTEALIAEQGREITGLRDLLEMARAEEERLLAEVNRHEEMRTELESQLLKSETLLANERASTQRALRDSDAKAEQELDSVRHSLERAEQEVHHLNMRLTSEAETKDDAIRSLTQKLQLAEQSHEASLAEMKLHYDATVDRLSTEVRSLKEAREVAEHKLKAEVERLSRGNEEITVTLRRDVESLRREKQELIDEHRIFKENTNREHARKVTDLQAAAEALQRDLAAERTIRQDTESSRQSLNIRCESLHATVAKLNSELEKERVDARTRERTADHEHHEALEELRSRNRAQESELGHLRQTVSRVELQLERANDEHNSLQNAFENAKSDHRQQTESLKNTLDAVRRQNEETTQQLSRTIDSLHEQRRAGEAEMNRLQRVNEELEAKAGAFSRQLQEERKALENATQELHAQMKVAGDLRAAIDAERAKLSEANATIAQRDADRKQIDQEEQALRDRLRDAQRVQSDIREEAAAVRRSHEQALLDAQRVHREVQQSLQEELGKTKDALAIAKEQSQQVEEANRALREEAGRWQREAIQKDHGYAEQLRSLRGESDDEYARLEAVNTSLREDLARCHNSRSAAMREVTEALHDAERRVQLMQDALDHERSVKHKLHDELRQKEQVAVEMQGTTRLLQSRLQTKEEDLRRAEQEAHESMAKVHEAHAVAGKKDAVIGQLTAKLRVLESRSNLTN